MGENGRGTLLKIWWSNGRERVQQFALAYHSFCLLMSLNTLAHTHTPTPTLSLGIIFPHPKLIILAPYKAIVWYLVCSLYAPLTPYLTGAARGQCQHEQKTCSLVVLSTLCLVFFMLFPHSTPCVYHWCPFAGELAPPPPPKKRGRKS